MIRRYECCLCDGLVTGEEVIEVMAKMELYYYCPECIKLRGKDNGN